MRNRLRSLLLSVSLAVSVVFGASLLMAPTAAAATLNYTGWSCNVAAYQPVNNWNYQLKIQGSAACSIPVRMLIDVFTQEWTTVGWNSFTWQSASTTGTYDNEVYYIWPVHGHYYRTSVNFFLWNGSGWVFQGTVNSPYIYSS